MENLVVFLLSLGACFVVLAVAGWAVERQERRLEAKRRAVWDARATHRLMRDLLHGRDR